MCVSVLRHQWCWMSLSKVTRSCNSEMLFSSFIIPWHFTDCLWTWKIHCGLVSLTATQCKIWAKVLNLCTSVFFNRQSGFVFAKALCQIFDSRHFTVLHWELSGRQNCFDSAVILIQTLVNGSFRWRSRQALQRGCSRTGSTRSMPPLCASWRCARHWVTTCSCQRSTTSWNSQSRCCAGFFLLLKLY